MLEAVYKLATLRISLAVLKSFFSTESVVFDILYNYIIERVQISRVLLNVYRYHESSMCVLHESCRHECNARHEDE